MVLKKRHMVEWERVVMPVKTDYEWPWSTWVALKREVEAKEPHNMTLLMQHAYARCPLMRCWKVKKRDADPREALGPRDYLFRRYVPKNYVAKNRELHPSFVQKERFILPRFRNVAAKVNDKWDRCPLDDRLSIVTQRRNAMSIPEEDDISLRKRHEQNSEGKSTEVIRQDGLQKGEFCLCKVDKNK